MKKTKAPAKAKGRAHKPAADPSAPPPQTGEPCPIVAFGASAGGLDAFTALLNEMPTDSGFAMVLVQHLDPQHASILTELLSRATNMHVTQVTDDTLVLPNRVYVIPPNKDLILAEGSLRLEPRSPAIPHMPVDRFFRSLANELGSKAIGVVLSGTASDGSQGVRAIKAGGGITFAQEPSTAQYDGMPRSAIDTGCIDAVLAPDGIARELLRLREHPYLHDGHMPEPEAESGGDDRSLPEIFTLLRNATGVDFSLYKPGTIRRRTLRRMALLKMENLAQYSAFVRQNPEEVTALFQDILINVTSFFREPATFEAIETSILPAIFKDRSPSDPIRIWVPGCATGEEVYSTAICLFEYMKRAAVEIPLQIFGTDLSEAALEKARAGIYPETIAGDVSAARLRRFFVRLTSGWQIARSVRDSCIFARHNLTKDPPFSKCDLILCRNVLIYLGAHLQNTAMRLFHYALQARGYLVLGMSESVGHATNLFHPVDKKIRIYSKKPAPLQLGADLGTYQDSHPHELHHQPLPSANLNTTHQKVDQMLLARYSPAALVVDNALRIIEFRGHTAPYLEHAAGEATLELTRMAPGGLGIEVQRLIRRAHTKKAPAKSTVSVSLRESIRNLNISVVPIQGDPAIPEHYLVILEEQAPGQIPEKKGARKLPGGNAAWAQRVKEVEQELAATREYLQTVIEEQEASTEELRSAHEEVQSGNEELQSTNEELLTAKEELQSTNEELTTVNEEMQGRNAELQQINNDLINLLSSVNIPIMMLGADLHIRRFTPQAEKLFSLRASDIGRPVSDLRLKINIADLIALSQEVLDDLSPREREVQDVEGHAYSMWVRPYRTAENRIEGVVLALFDITERKQAAARYRRLFETAADGILIADAASGAILDVNPPLLRLSGYGRAGLIGIKFWESPLFQGSGFSEEALEQLRARESLRKSFAICTESGRRIETEMVCNLYAEGEKKVIQFNVRDIRPRRLLETQLRMQEEQSHQSQKMEAVGRLASGVAHDYNDLLTTLLGHCDLLAEQLEQSQADRTNLDEIRAAAERAAKLTSQLLAFGRQQAAPAVVLDLNEVIGRSQQLLLLMLPENVHLETRLHHSPVLVKADYQEVEQVLLNLVIHARDAMSDGGLLLVQTGEMSAGDVSTGGGPALPPGDYATIAVKDTGSGMDAEAQGHLFEPFSATRGKGGGMELGLATAYHIVQQSGGYIMASSTLGAGSTITVYLPKASRDEEENRSARVPPPGGTESILLVDDEPAVRQLTTKYLKGLGYQVLEASNGPDAIRVARDHPGPIALLLTDVVMPHMSGREVAFQLATVRQDMKVLYMSGHNQEVIMHHGVLGDATSFLPKPFRLPDLAVKVRAVLDR